MSHFSNDSRKKSGHATICQGCRRKKSHQYYLKNKERITKNTLTYRKTHSQQISERDKKYRLLHKEQRKIYLQKNKQKIKKKRQEYEKKNRQRINFVANKYYQNRLKCDVNFRLAHIFRCRIKDALKYQKTTKENSSSVLLGCSIVAARKYIQSKFKHGMTWKKFLNGEIHIDHIKPCIMFDLTNPEEQQRCFSLSNLQPLWKIDNLQKGSRYE